MPVSEIAIFNDPEDYQAALCREASFNLLVKGRGEFQARLVRLALTQLSISEGTELLARVATVTVPRHLVRISLPLRSAQSLAAGQSPRTAHEITTQGAGHRSLECTTEACGWRSIWLSAEILAKWSGTVEGVSLQVPSGECRWHPKRNALDTLERLLDDAIRLIVTKVGVAANVHAARGLEQDIALALIECLTDGPTQHTRVIANRRAEIVLRFDDRLREPLGWKTAVSAFCTHLGVSGRNLRAYCRATLGMGPSQYIRLYRMELARRALHGSSTGTASVTKVARSYGFKNLGRFAADYRRQFGELPSQTLSRGSGVLNHQRALTGCDKTGRYHNDEMR